VFPLQHQCITNIRDNHIPKKNKTATLQQGITNIQIGLPVL
jgi:hypothetical protein